MAILARVPHLPLRFGGKYDSDVDSGRDQLRTTKTLEDRSSLRAVRGNLAPDGNFHPPEVLRRRFEKILKSVPVQNAICYCGSGVTAAHNLIAMAYAGPGMGRLCPVSWSEWILYSARPVATGAD